jgi:hypothetical protein
MIQPYYEQMLTFLKMEDEIPFKEFNDYYQQVLKELDNYKSYDKELAIQALFIMDNLKSNSDSRVQRKFAEAKKYKKISARAHIWIEALFVHLVNAGMTEQEIKDKIEEMYEAA